jgi:hypothetical protein
LTRSYRQKSKAPPAASGGKRARFARHQILEGTNEIMRVIVARGLIES